MYMLLVIEIFKAPYVQCSVLSEFKSQVSMQHIPEKETETNTFDLDVLYCLNKCGALHILYFVHVVAHSRQDSQTDARRGAHAKAGVKKSAFAALGLFMDGMKCESHQSSQFQRTLRHADSLQASRMSGPPGHAHLQCRV